jgi:hypothetical protein
MAGAFGYQFIFGSVIFYLFLGVLLSLGGDKYLAATIPNIDPNSLTGLNLFTTLIFNPFTAGGIVAWLGIALGVTNAYIIITSLIP